ncbi:unnamed protein product, partial [Ectocarpus sp. 8 AP-2014]
PAALSDFTAVHRQRARERTKDGQGVRPRVLPQAGPLRSRRHQAGPVLRTTQTGRHGERAGSKVRNRRLQETADVRDPRMQGGVLLATHAGRNDRRPQQAVRA